MQNFDNLYIYIYIYIYIMLQISCITLLEIAIIGKYCFEIKIAIILEIDMYGPETSCAV